MNTDDIENLKKDFYRFAQLHSWYKHIRLEGKTFVFFKTNEQQVRYDFDKQLTKEERKEYWHFIDSNNKEYIKKLINNGVILYCAKFGPFFRGIEKHGMFRGYNIIMKLNKNIEIYLQEKYSEILANVKACDIGFYENQQIFNDIVIKEQTEYLNDVLKFKLFCDI